MATAYDTAFGDRAVCYPDYVFNEFALPDETNYTSSAFVLGNTQAGIRIDGWVTTGVSQLADKTLTIELYTAATRAGAYTLAETLYVAEGVTVLVADDILFEYIPALDEKMFYKVKVTADDDLSAGAISVNLTGISH